jgi:hypothetical protein
MLFRDLGVVHRLVSDHLRRCSRDRLIWIPLRVVVHEISSHCQHCITETLGQRSIRVGFPPPFPLPGGLNSSSMASASERPLDDTLPTEEGFGISTGIMIVTILPFLSMTGWRYVPVR